ncbi:hypothetical protein [Methylobacterium trifolii]|uniref:Formate dehydrogenase F4B subunit n=1 Tax=Methylobacterium trifolii TaxID=1003092 RepID=A0ABQ4U2Q5_9HYPH|nr:hypothetical protein [Methylobacterium trifolii]GJE60608.1 hypothetical protein MPOCJGCO_2722 [Methylobacterium trifolii]
MSEAAFLGLVAEIVRRRSGLTSLEAGILAALHLGLPADSRSFAKAVAVEHALVLRALAGLDEAGLVTLTGRDPRTQRTRYRASPDGLALTMPPGG